MIEKLCFVLLGFLLGYAFKLLVFRIKTARKAFVAPTPVDLGYDQNSPINGGSNGVYNVKRGESVIIDGSLYYRVQKAGVYMYVLKRDKQIIGYFDTFPEAVAALEEERQKEDGVELSIEQEKEGL